MRKLLIFCVLIFICCSVASPKTKGSSAIAPSAVAKEVDFPQLDKELAQWKPVKMPFDAAGLSARQQQMVRKLVDACHQIEDIFLRQSDPEAVGLIETLSRSNNPKDKKILRMLRIMGGRYDLLADNKPFIGTQPMSPDR